MISCLEALRQASKRLQDIGIESARLDSEVLLAHVLKMPREQLFLDLHMLLEDEQLASFTALIDLRAAHMPVARIIGHKEFWSLDFLVNEATLVPRADSETLVEAALQHCRDKGLSAPKLLDIGTGSGCLLIALLSEMHQASGVGLDISAKAIETAKENARRLGVAARAKFAEVDLFLIGNESGLLGGFDIVLSNPPYIHPEDFANLMPEVKNYDPELALVGGSDGLAVYRHLAKAAGAFLKPEGRIYFEIGAGQADDVAALMADAGWANISRHQDLSGIDRVIVAKKG